MAAIMAANMAAITTTKPHNLWTARPIMLKFCWYVNYMILHMLHLLIYKNSRWPPSWLPIWPPLQLQNPITSEPLDQLCSNFCWYVNYMILHMFHLSSYKNSKWPPSWSPLKLKSPKTFEPIDKFCWLVLFTFQMIMILICVTQQMEHM